ncbi:Ger(x)C family spore germination protein [Anaerofustis stercorihominis]|uniref:Germination protein, Ger(X)C family n=3 Tax=Anaerofustis stercorihominis TaxID=214853 RepID=B1C6U3_9FIRM|nr:Ger(x)C family spore germination protein [Anaerofustis stercorihominis]EDS72730.1 germination protein, Ger(x)C family [Anaerofustis stercorihominis DSM 17244]MCQ4794104.1 Ger(x)C family spore germination protein [Anaerofustis stercorihominis]
MKGKKILSIILLTFIIPLLCSCYDYSELEREILIFTLGIDKVSDGYVVSAETLDASDYGGELNVKPEVITSKGDSIYEALSILDGKFNNKVNLTHCELIIVGEKYAKEDGIYDILNLVYEKNNLRFNTIFTTTYDSSAEEILMSKEGHETFHGFEILEQLSKNKLFSDNSRAYKIINSIENSGIELTLPVIKVAKSEEKKNFYANKIAVFRGDKLAGYIDDKDVNYYSLLMNEKNSIQIKMKEEDNLINAKVSLKKTRTSIKNNRLNIDMDVNAYIESNKKKNTSKEKLKSALENKLKRDLNNFIEETQKRFKLDICGYGYQLNNYKEKKNNQNWNRYYENLNRNIDVHVTLKEDMEE